MDVTDTLLELIKRGEELVPQGGDPIVEGCNGALQPEYGSWRLQAISAITRNATTRDVFVVHGHDAALLNQDTRFLEKLELTPIVLFEQPGRGQTVIEKLETSSNVGRSIDT
jgi:hypothetical protein